MNCVQAPSHNNLCYTVASTSLLIDIDHQWNWSYLTTFLNELVLNIWSFVKSVLFTSKFKEKFREWIAIELLDG